MAISKKYLKTKPICKVSFTIPAELGANYKRANLVGTFNNWNEKSLKMKKLVKDGSFSLVVDLELDKEYEFKYLLDGKVWLTEKDADKQVTTHFGDSQNSVIKI
ncbi:MAG: glycoside hydrolase family 13 [Ignavibacteriae bacterium]|nr:MAG: glycoside hydrolase family 13 [Ignavibacteriota bacterium]